MYTYGLITLSPSNFSPRHLTPSTDKKVVQVKNSSSRDYADHWEELIYLSKILFFTLTHLTGNINNYMNKTNNPQKYSKYFQLNSLQNSTHITIVMTPCWCISYPSRLSNSSSKSFSSHVNYMYVFTSRIPM